MEEDKEREEHFRNAYSNCVQVLSLGFELDEKLKEADEGLSFPD